MSGQRVGCVICDTLPPGDLVELDLLMGDPTRWPKTIWGIFNAPKGTLSASYRRYGAMEMGANFLAEKGYSFTRLAIRRHLRFDVVPIASNADELVAAGLISDSKSVVAPLTGPIDPKAYITFFGRGIELGNRGLELLAGRVEKMIAAGEDVPMATLKMIAELGAKLATTQATIRARGGRVDDGGDEEEGFRAGVAPLPSQRFNHTRIRVIDGDATPMRDEGPADRAHFSERNRMEGGSGLPHR